MTGLLTRVMHDRADTAGTPDLDLDAIIAAGDRRVRRRRVTTGIAAASVAGVVAVAGLAVPRMLDHDDHAPAPTTSPFTARQVSWAEGSTIHWGERAFAVGKRVRSYVPTDEGFVWTSPDGTVRFFDGIGNVVVGTAEGGRLVADDSGSYVAWTTPGTRQEPASHVVFDTSTRTSQNFVAAATAEAPDDEAPTVMALDADWLYVREGNLLSRRSLVSRVTETLWAQEGPVDPATKAEPAIWQVVDVAAGSIAYFVERVDTWGLAVGSRVDPTAPVVSTASNGYLSPDGRLLASEQDDFIAVHDTATGQDVSPDLGGYPYAVGYGWVDDDTVMAYGLTDLDGDGPYPADILTCDIGAGCTVVASVDISEGSFALPVGRPLD